MMKHRKVASMLSGIVEDCNAGRLEKPVIKTLVELPKDKKVIWQYWAQGTENVPPLVRICLDSVDKYAPTIILFVCLTVIWQAILKSLIG